MREPYDVITWAEAATEAGFVPFELADPRYDKRRAGGYGSGDPTDPTDDRGPVPVSLQIVHLVDGLEVTIETGHGAILSDADVSLRAQINSLLWDAMWAQEELRLPVSWTVEAEDRTVAVDGEATLFRGARLAETGAWAGTAELGSGLHVVIRTNGPVRTAAIATCSDIDMPDGRDVADR